MEPPITPPRIRPPVLRTYGKSKREPLLFPILSPPPLTHSDSFKSSDGSSCLPSSEIGFGEDLNDEVPIRSSSPPEDALAGERSSIDGLRWVKREPTSTSASNSTDIEPSKANPLKALPRGRKSSLKSMPEPISGQSTLRAFFAPRPITVGPSTSGSRLRTESLPSSSPIPSTTPITSESPSSPFLPNTPSSSQPKKLVQMHFKRSSLSSNSASSFTTCKKCNLSYIQGEPESPAEALHTKNCERVTRGVVWDDRGSSSSSVGKGSGLGKQVREEVRFERRGQGGSGGSRGRYKGIGRVIQVDGSDGFNNAKVADILSSIDTVLSAPPLPTSTLKQCQIFLFLTSSPPPPPISGKRLAPSAIGTQRKGKNRERVVGCVVTQGIRWGMKVVTKRSGDEVENEAREEGSVGGKRKCEGLVVVESSTGDGPDDGGILCYPERIPVKMGVHRIFTVPSYRGCGIIKSLLDEACKHTIYGYKCDPLKGDVAFSQPTQSGRRVMNTWGEGQVLVFNEDEQEDDRNEED